MSFNSSNQEERYATVQVLQSISPNVNRDDIKQMIRRGLPSENKIMPLIFAF